MTSINKKGRDNYAIYVIEIFWHDCRYAYHIQRTKIFEYKERGTIWIFASGKVPLTIRNVFPFVIANTIFFGDWGTGREKYKKLQQAEMDKMKARDIN